MISMRHKACLLAALVAVAGAALSQERQQRRPDPGVSATAPVKGARRSENLQRANASRAANEREKLALVEALVAESRGDLQALDKAQAELAPVLERNARNVDANLLAGRIATMKNQPLIAAQHYRAVIAVNSNNADAHLGLGNALTAMQDTQGADAAFARYRELMGLGRP